MNSVVKVSKKDKAWERLTYGLDKLFPLVANPISLFVGGFVLSNVLEHTVIGKTNQDETTTDINPGSVALGAVFPWLLPFTANKSKTIPAGTNITAITKDQGNVLRAGLVAMAVGQSGLLSNAGNVLTGISGLIK